MKNFLFALGIVSVLSIAACTNRTADKNRLDSIAVDRAADSMIHAADGTDTARTDKTTVDSSAIDSLRHSLNQ